MASFELLDLSVMRGKKLILEQINLRLEDSKLGAVLAPNGSGKTTLMQAIISGSGICHGGAFYDGIDLFKLSVAQRSHYIAFVPQYFECAFDYNVLDFVLLGRSNQLGFFLAPSDFMRQEAVDLLQDLGILDLQNRFLSTLSGGQKQMVLLTRALFQKSKILFLDEPTAWLDLKNQWRFFDVLKTKIKEYQLCALMNIHDPNLVCKYANEVFMIKDGKNLCSGKMQEVMQAQNLSLLYDIAVDVKRMDQELFVCY